MRALLIYLISIQAFCQFASAQESLRFVNEGRKKAVEVRVGHTLAVAYTAYNGQMYFDRNVVTHINDSSIELGYAQGDMPDWVIRALERSNQYHRVIQFKDIREFRRITAARQVLKSVVNLAFITGSYLLVANVLNDGSYSNGSKFLISFGSALVSVSIVQMLFPEKTKYRMADGWTFKVNRRKH